MWVYELGLHEVSGIHVVTAGGFHAWLVSQSDLTLHIDQMEAMNFHGLCTILHFDPPGLQLDTYVTGVTRLEAHSSVFQSPYVGIRFQKNHTEVFRHRVPHEDDQNILFTETIDQDITSDIRSDLRDIDAMHCSSFGLWGLFSNSRFFDWRMDKRTIKTTRRCFRGRLVDIAVMVQINHGVPASTGTPHEFFTVATGFHVVSPFRIQESRWSDPCIYTGYKPSTTARCFQGRSRSA